MIDLDAKHDVFGPDDIKLGEIVHRKFYHNGQSMPEYVMTADGLVDADGALVARFDGDDLVRADDGITRFTLKASA